MRYPIVILWLLATVGAAWLALTQIIIPAFSRNLPFFPSFRPVAKRKAKEQSAQEELAKAEQILYDAQQHLKHAQRFAAWDEENAKARLDSAMRIQKEAVEKYKRLFSYGEPKEEPKTPEGGTQNGS